MKKSFVTVNLYNCCTGCIRSNCHVFERLCSFTYLTEFGLQYAKLKLKTGQIDQKNNIFNMASSFKLSRWCFLVIRL